MFRPPTKYSEYLIDVRKSIDYILKRVNATTVTKIVAGTNVTISPASGTGAVTINASGGGGGGLPAGGTTGQILAKINNVDYNAEWIDNYAQWTSTLKQEVKASESINKGQAVYVSTADGTNMIVSKSSNTTEATSSKTLGLLAQNLAINGKGFVITEGLLSGLDTSTANIGDPVWLGANGNLIFGLVNKPYAPLHLVSIGIVTRVNSNNGEIFVKVQNGFELDELHNVDARNPNNNDGIFYNSSTLLWEHKPVSSVYATPTLAQVTTAGNTTTNAIGIGTTGPIDFNLVVEGVMQVRNAASSFTGLRIDSASIRKRDTGTFSLGTNDTTSFNIFAPTNNIGINTTTDSGYKLDINGTTRVQGATTINNRYLYHQGDSAIQYFMTSNAWSGTNTIFFGDDSSSTIGSISYNHQFDSLRFNVNGSNALFIDSSRNVGIDTSSPLFKVDISNRVMLGQYPASSTYGAVYLGNITPSSTNYSLTSNSLDTYLNGTNVINFSINDVIKARIANTGNVLIGTTTDAGYKLDVNGTTALRGTTDVIGGTLRIASTGTLTQPSYITSHSDGGWNFTTYTHNRGAGVHDFTSNNGSASIFSASARAGVNINVSDLTTGNPFSISGTVNASSAIARGQLINTTLVAAANNDVLVGLDINPTFTNGAFTGVTNTSIRVRGTNAYALTMQRSVDGIGGANAYFNRSRGTVSIPTTLQDADFIGTFIFAGYDGTNFQEGALFGGFVDGTISSGSVPTGIQFITGTSIINRTERMRIKGNGNILINTTTDAGYKLDVNGTIRSSGTNGFILYDGTYGAKVSMSSYIFTIEKEGTYGVSTYLFKYSDGSSALSLNGTTILGLGGSDDAVMMSRNVYAPASGSFGFTTYGGTTKYKAIQALFTDNNTSGVAFNYKTAGTDTEAMRITSTGNVGIGTTSPIEKVDITTSADNQFALVLKSITGRINFKPYLNSTYGALLESTNLAKTAYNPLTLSGSKILMLDGNVIIGATTDDGYKLSVNGTARVQSDALVTGTLTANAITCYSNVNAVHGFYSGGLFTGTTAYTSRGFTSTVNTPFVTYNISSPLANPNNSSQKFGGYGFVFDGSTQWYQGVGLSLFTTPGPDVTVNVPVERLRISSSGNVGIGTTSPSYPLHISSSAAANIFATVQATNASASAAWVGFNDQSDNIVYRIFGSSVSGTQFGQSLTRSASLIANLGGSGKFLIGTYSSTDLVFGTGDQSRMRLVDSTGNFLIGTMTDAGYKLYVSGNIKSTSDIITDGILKSNYQAGDEGGEINLNVPVTGTSISTSVTIDVYQNKLRIFETGGTNRGGYFDISALSAGVGTNFSPTGYTGILNIPGNPVGSRIVTIQNGIITNIA